MRYCIREATSSDEDRVAALIDENAGEWSGSTAGDAVDDRDLRAVARLVFDEMLEDCDRLENVTDSRKTSAIGLLKSLGSAVEPAETREGFQARSHRVWLSGGHRLRTLAN